MEITGFPFCKATDKYQQHTGDQVQNMLAPYVKVCRVEFHGLPIEFEYITLADAYGLVKRALNAAGDTPPGDGK